MLYEWTGNVVRGEPITVADRSLGRDYTYVADSSAGIAAMLDAPSLSHNVYNVSAGSLVTLEDIIQALTELRPSLQVIEDPSKEFPILARGGSRGVINITRLREGTGLLSRLRPQGRPGCVSALARGFGLFRLSAIF